MVSKYRKIDITPCRNNVKEAQKKGVILRYVINPAHLARIYGTNKVNSRLPTF